MNDVIRNVLPRYRRDKVQVTSADYEADIGRILRAFGTDSKAQRDKLLAALRETAFVMTANAGDGSKGRSKPGNLYLATERLKELFAGVADVFLVDDAYSCLRGEDIRDLLEACGATRSLQPLVVNSAFTGEKLREMRIAAGCDNITYSELIEDHTLRGLDSLLKLLLTLDGPNRAKKAALLWEALDDSGSAPVTRLDIRRLIELSRRTGVDVFAQLVEWAAELGNAVEVLKRLEELDINTLQQLNSLVGITSLKAVLETWEINQTNSDEEFWQDALEQNAFVLSQVFSFPILIIRGKAYIGGKVIDNKGGHLADFLAANPVTRNAIIIEIKTPETDLLGRKYRMDVYSASEELSGAILQVLNYRYNLMTEFLSIRRGREELFDVFSPHCLVVAGHARRQLQTENHVRSFEMFRSSHKDVFVVTYDELFDKTKQLLQTLEGTVIDGSRR